MFTRQPDKTRVPNGLMIPLLAGFVGTAVMTVAMAAMRRCLPAEQQGPLPPRQISMAAAKRVGVKDRMDEQTRFSTTMALHFGYGTVVGALYAPLADTVPGCSPFKGMAFGVLVWTGSYLGWLPMSGLLSSATRHPAARNVLMIAAHLVWGSVIAMIVEHAERGKGNRTETVRTVPGHRGVGQH
jgi:uncharacterized membrane protein YagU involved in acid resistance